MTDRAGKGDVGEGGAGEESTGKVGADSSRTAWSRARQNRLRNVYVALGVAVVVLGLLSIAVGRVSLGWHDLLMQGDVRGRAILIELRLPRTLLAILVGGALGLSGAALQGYLRNPLADPGVLGISSSAALGAVMTIFFGIADRGPWTLSFAAVGGGILGVLLLFLMAGTTASRITLVLAGIALSSLTSAGTALALSLAPNPWASGQIIDWLMGALTDRSNNELSLAVPLIAAGAVAIFACRRSLDALTLGEAGARSLGIDLDRTQWQLALGVGLAVGASVAVTGIIGFVGLVTPHLLRPLVGARPGALLLPSALGGAVLVLAADIIVRLIPAATELRLGVAMSLVGAPFFLMLLLSTRRNLI